MAIRFDADGEDFTRALSLGSQTQLTVTGWFKISVDRGQFTTLWAVAESDFDSFLMLAADGTGTGLQVINHTNGTALTTLTVGTWYFVGVAINGTSQTILVRSASASSFTVTTNSSGPSSAVVADVLGIGETPPPGGFEWLNGAVANFKIWVGATLTQAEMEREAWTYLPWRTSGLTAWYPWAGSGSTVDLSGNGRTLSGGSGTSLEDGPPIAWRQGRRRLFLPTSIDVEANPAPILAPWSMPAPAVSAGASTAPGVIEAPWSMPAPVVEVFEGLPTVAEPGVILAPWSMPAPLVDAFSNATAAPGPILAPWTLPTPAVLVPIVPGDQITGPGQIEWNGFLLGRGTPYGLGNLEGWYDLPAIDTGNVAHPTRHGAESGRDLSQERIVTYSGLTRAPRDDWEETVEDLILATGVGEDDTEYPLAIRLLDHVYTGMGKVTRRAVPVDKHFRLGHSRIVVQWTLSDPRLLSKLNSAVIADGETQTILNAGNTATSPLIRIPGPSVIPQILFEPLVGGEVVDERLIEVDLTVADGENLIIDVKLGTISIGDTDHLDKLTGTSTSVPDLVLPAGQVRVSYTSEEGDAPPATVLWKHAIL
ncbi:hypothetical protein GCM10009555_017310 [Acrocarpospora macrocephala]|uniref:Uncharacterized protein n=1 Tax=Acrocarpospora macrocephala TaxID=150177 RepID=A0A5M3WJM7_9ACTN|nr:LamG-like jellyroll fold domain-containing protein [Acrocarpospora macrocephala]GES07391.1 hypothetical protein Amac_009860 [Acrocarpospora macrocephala]